MLARITTTRRLRSLEDNNQDGKPDLDGRGDQIWNGVSKTDATGSTLSVPIVAKVDGAIANHQASISLVLQPMRTTNPPLDSAPSTERLITSTTLDLVGRWNAHLGDRGPVLDVTAGWHRQRWTSDAANDEGKQLVQHQHEIRLAASADFASSRSAEVYSGGEIDSDDSVFATVTKLWRPVRTVDGFALDSECSYGTSPSN